MIGLVAIALIVFTPPELDLADDGFAPAIAFMPGKVTYAPATVAGKALSRETKKPLLGRFFPVLFQFARGGASILAIFCSRRC
jgi:hypothetical protein